MFYFCHVERSRDISKYFWANQGQTTVRDSSTSLGMTSGSGIIAPVQVREKIVAPFAIGQKFFIKLPGNKLIV
jgi:hypothetical protein